MDIHSLITKIPKKDLSKWHIKLVAYHPNKNASVGSPAHKAASLGHVWVKAQTVSGRRWAFDSSGNYLGYFGPGSGLAFYFSVTPIAEATEEAAADFIYELCKVDALFHFDEDPGPQGHLQPYINEVIQCNHAVLMAAGINYWEVVRKSPKLQRAVNLTYGLDLV